MTMTGIEREPEYREPRNVARNRNHSSSMKLEIPKAAAAAESPLKPNGEETLYFCLIKFIRLLGA